MAETGKEGDLSRRGFLVAAGVAALGLAGLRMLTEGRKRSRPGPATPPRQAGTPTGAAPPPRETVRMRARVTETCFACGLCCQICPEVFVLGSQFAEVIVPEVPAQAQEECRQAARDCPAQAIVIEEG